MRDVQPHYELQLRVLEAVASAERYNRWIASLALPHLGEHPIEIGSGLGDQAALWLEAGVPRITLSDLEPRSVESLRERFSDEPRVDLLQLDLATLASGSYSAVVALNVLEHIEDDAKALIASRSLVRPRGRVIVFVPAFPFAMSRFDREIGHFRRYTKQTLVDRFVAAGLEPISARYVNAPGLIAWFVMMKLLRGRPSDGRLVRLWDRTAIPPTRAVETRWAAPFGQSLLMVGIARS